MRKLLATLLLVLLPASARAWPASLMEALARDARRLVPRSLGQLMLEREPQILDDLRHFPPTLSQTLAADLQAGKLQPETLAALEAQAADALELFKQRRVSEGVVRLAAFLRVPADLSDPILNAGPEGYPSGVVREYYAFIEGNLDKIPVVMDDAPALKLSRRELPAYWQRLLSKSRGQADVIRSEMFQNGRVVSSRAIDYRSPVFGVASLSYSRAVTAIAATWLAVWREARGDVTRMPKPREVPPKDDPQAARIPTPAPLRPPEAP
jgi:hypothetical protein